MRRAQPSAVMQQQVADDERRAREYVQHEFEQPWDRDDLVARELHNQTPGVRKVFGGVESSQLRELQLCQAWRPKDGAWELAHGVIHRVHHDRTVTVQFLPDQHRCRLPVQSVKAHLDITPTYPEVVLGQGERLPTQSEIAQREQNAGRLRQLYDIPGDAPIPGLRTEDHNPLGQGEHRDAEGNPAVWGDHWAIPAPTQDALRNRSVPSSQITGVYGQHFYSNLYKNNFYPDVGHAVSQTGHVDLASEHQQVERGRRVVSHRLIALDGYEYEQDMKTGEWKLAPEFDPKPPMDPPGWFG